MTLLLCPGQKAENSVNGRLGCCSGADDLLHLTGFQQVYLIHLAQIQKRCHTVGHRCQQVPQGEMFFHIGFQRTLGGLVQHPGEGGLGQGREAFPSGDGIV